MPMPSIDEMRQNVRDAEAGVTAAQNTFGKNSGEYKTALKQFAVAWFVLTQSLRDDRELIDSLVS